MIGKRHHHEVKIRITNQLNRVIISIVENRNQLEREKKDVDAGKMPREGEVSFHPIYCIYSKKSAYNVYKCFKIFLYNSHIRKM
jgi:hypothetical protein